MSKKTIAFFAALMMIFTCFFSAACKTDDPPEKTPLAEKTANEYTDERMMLGMYHITPVIDDVKNQIKFEDAVEGDLFNVFLMSRVEIPDETQFDYYCNSPYRYRL